jgi:hypothetical protein
VRPRAVHYQAGKHWDGYPVIACGLDMLAIPRVTAIPDHVTCGSCRRTRAWRDAYATTGRTE